MLCSAFAELLPRHEFSLRLIQADIPRLPAPLGHWIPDPHGCLDASCACIWAQFTHRIEDAAGDGRVDGCLQRVASVNHLGTSIISRLASFPGVRTA